MHDLAKLIAERIAAGLKRKSLTKCSTWAEACRVMGRPYPGPWNFRHHPWLREMHDSVAEMNIGQKSAQMGYTETALNITFFKIDVQGIDCLYVLPAKTPDASDFSAARFDPALELSPHLAKLFSDVKNIGHKRAGTTNLYIRGSKARSGLKSVPVGFIVLDEVDEMEQDNIPLALERTSGQLEKQVWALSTPTIDNYGVNKLYNLSTQEHFFFKCPSCGKRTELIFPDCLVITANDLHDENLKNSHYICKECKTSLPQAEKAEWLSSGMWVPSYGDREARGFHVNQLYSCTISPVDLARSFLRSQRDPADEQEFLQL
jgi:phage terminase large subunit GpA-like protein